MVNEGPSLNDNKKFFQVNSQQQQQQQSFQNYNNVQQQQQQQQQQSGQNRNFMQSTYGASGYPAQNEYGVFQRGLASP